MLLLDDGAADEAECSVAEPTLMPKPTHPRTHPPHLEYVWQREQPVLVVLIHALHRHTSPCAHNLLNVLNLQQGRRGREQREGREGAG